jgi:hypothetical protein
MCAAMTWMDWAEKYRYRRYFIDENIDIVSISKMGYRPITKATKEISQYLNTE